MRACDVLNIGREQLQRQHQVHLVSLKPGDRRYFGAAAVVLQQQDDVKSERHRVHRRPLVSGLLHAVWLVSERESCHLMLSHVIRIGGK